jgi:hypothetical protein
VRAAEYRKRLTGFKGLLTSLGTTDGDGTNARQALSGRRDIFLQAQSISNSARGWGLMVQQITRLPDRDWS